MTDIREQLLALAQEFTAPYEQGSAKWWTALNCAEKLTALADQLDGDMGGTAVRAPYLDATR